MLPLRDNLKVHKSAVVVWTLIIINVLVFSYEVVNPNPAGFVSKWGLVPSQVDFGIPVSLIPFFTANFLHGGFIHLLGNMWFLAVFGRSVEAAFGHFKFLFFYLFWGLVAFAAQYFLIAGSNLPMIGASGAVAGILGAYLVFYPQARVLTLVPIFIILTTVWIPAFFFIPYWFLIQLFSGTAQVVQGVGAEAGVAFWAHVGGFIAGFLTAKFSQTKFKRIYYGL